MIKVRAHTCYLGTTGYAHHSRKFFRELSKHVDLRVRNYTWDSNPDYLDEMDLDIIDTITLRNNQNIDEDFHISRSFPNLNWKHKDSNFSQDVDIVLMDSDHHYFYQEYNSNVKIAYTVWESTELPEKFFDQLLKFDYLWVATKWHKEVVVKQGYPAYRVFVVNEGVNQEFFENNVSIPEEENDRRFKFMFFGRWDYRKSLPEIINSFLKAFPNGEKVDLILSADNPYSVDGMKSTEERLAHYGYSDSRIKVKHFLNREDYVSYIKNGNVLITCARSEGWNIPLIEAMASGTPVIYSDWGGQLEFAYGKGNPVKIKEELPASIGAKLGFACDTPGLYAEPDFSDLTEVIKDCYFNYKERKECAELERNYIIKNFNWEKIGVDGFNSIKKVTPKEISKYHKKESVVVLSHADTEEKISILNRSIISLKNQGYFVILSSHIQVPSSILNMIDYFICETDNPIVNHEEYSSLSNTVPIHFLKFQDFNLSYSFDYNHGYAALRLIQNGASVSMHNGFKKTHFVNYDYIIDDDNLLDLHSELLNESSIVTYRWNPEKSINSAFFSGITKDIISSLSPIKSKSDYFKYEGIVILEDFLYACFSDSWLKMEIREISEIQGKNYINSIIVPTYPSIKTKNGKSSYIYLGETKDKDIYLCAMGNEEILRGDVYIGENIFKIEAGAYPMNFYPIEEEDLEKGFKVILPDYKESFEYNNKSRKASIEILNTACIKRLEEKDPSININFIDGPFVEIKDAGSHRFDIEFIDSSNNEIIYQTNIGNNSWARPSIKYYKNWEIKVTNTTTGKIFTHTFNLKNKNVLVSIDSSSLGDNIAWFPHIEEFSKINQCKVFVSTFKNELFEKNYPDLTFVNPGKKVDNIYASYNIGWYYNGNEFDKNRNPRDFKNIPLQETTTDILGIKPSNLKPNIVTKSSIRPIDKKYVCIGVHSTAQAKYWNNPNGWQELTNWFIEKEYEVVILSSENNGYMGNTHPIGAVSTIGPKTLDNAIRYLKNCDMFIGLGSGLSWLSWALNTPTVIISGFSNPISEPVDSNIIRIFNSKTCNSCFNRHKLDAGDWNWCPDHKNTPRQFECTKSITSNDVITQIEDYFNKGYAEKSIETIIHESYYLGMVQNHKEILEASEFFKSLNVKNFMEIGTDQGGTFAIWSKLSEDGIRISVDMPHGQFGRADYDEYKRDEYLKSLGSNVHMFWGSSHDYKMLEDVNNIIGDIQLDFLFIDGDHTYEGVKQDYEMYKHLVKPGGWIGFHDIKDTEFHRNANCRVDILWNELEGAKKEFIDHSSCYGGIGFIQM